MAATATVAFSFLPQSGHAQSPQHEALPLLTDSVIQPEVSTAVQQRAHRTRLAIEPHQINLGKWTYQGPQKGVVNGATQVGASRSIPETQSVQDFQQQTSWIPTATGGWALAISMRSPEAYALRLGVEITSLPATSILRVYSQSNHDEVYETSGQNVLGILQNNRRAGEDGIAAHTWWAPEIQGEEATLEIELPPGTERSQVQITIPRLIHIYADIFSFHGADGVSFDPNVASSCNIDASCHDGYDMQRNSVARMSYVDNGSGYICTGTLLNDAASSHTPYFLTANHCISTQSAASSLQTWWFYRSTSCNDQSVSANRKILRNGAVLLHASANADFSLLRLNDVPPAGAVFSGWDAATMAIGQSLVGIHHPTGDLQKISFGELSSYANCDPIQGQSSFSCYLTYDPTRESSYYYVKWQSGTTEGGSSGSGLFHSGRLTGVLSGGSGSCSQAEKTSVYGKFSSILPALKGWLTTTTTGTPENPAVQRQAVYRFFNSATGAHFYTNSTPERDAIISSLPTYRYEGIGFYAATQKAPGLNPVARFFNNDSNSHFYTISPEERESIQASLPQLRYEGLTWYASPVAVSGMRPIYRFYNQQTGAHFYTATEGERDTVINNLPHFRYEGVAYYVWSTP